MINVIHVLPVVIGRYLLLFPLLFLLTGLLLLVGLLLSSSTSEFLANGSITATGENTDLLVYAGTHSEISY